MKSNKVGTTLKHPETINGIVKNLSKSDILLYLSFPSDILLYLSFPSFYLNKGECHLEMKDKGECHFYFKNLTLPLNTRVGTFLNSTSKAKLPFSAHQNTSFPPPPPPAVF
jgi:hypothetical protein